MRDRGWSYFDAIVAAAPLQHANPWVHDGGRAAYRPDYATLERLLGVPVLLKATSQSGVPALALDGEEDLLGGIGHCASLPRARQAS